MTPGEANDSVIDGLKAALHKPGGPGRLRVLNSLADSPDRACVVVGPPAFAWEGHCDPDQPTSMTASIYLIEQLHERAAERLLVNLPELLTAVAGVNDATVTEAVPGTYPTSGSDLPCYRLTVEMTL